LPERLTTKVADGHGNSIHSQWSVNVPLGGERSRRCAEVPGALDAAWRAPAPSGHLLRCSSRRLDSTSRWRGSRGGEATEGAELGDEHERALAGRPERPRSLGGRVVDPSHREGARASDGGRPCLGDSWGLCARGWSVLAAAREVGVSRTTGAAGGTVKPPPGPCGVPELEAGPLMTSGNRRVGMIPTCRCGYLIFRQVLGLAQQQRPASAPAGGADTTAAATRR